MLDLFTPIAEDKKQHPIFRMLLQDQYRAEREVLNLWANGFEDRDGKFIYEFQTTFESSMWELYLHAFLKELGAQTDFAHSAPDFVTTLDRPLTIEATIAAPPQGGTAPAGHKELAPQDFAEFNKLSAIRISNSLSAKIKKYRTGYSKLDHVKDKPYVIGLASFEQPYSHYAINRAIVAVLYGIYVDEESTIAEGAKELIRYPVSAVFKNENTTIPVGLFTTDEYKDVSAVIYSSLATWGKIKAMANKPKDIAVYNTLHAHSKSSLIPEVRSTMKADYEEDIADGIYIIHNPFAEQPIQASTFHHKRIAQYFIDQDGGISISAPEDFLLVREIISMRIQE